MEQPLTTLPRQLTPMMQQYAQAKAEHPDAVVLFRLGDFYEMFAEDAVTCSRLLELVLTSREVGKGRRIAMCGVPVHAVEAYIARLIDAGCKVAICEQMEDARFTKGLVRREIIRVITPGTVVEEGMLAEGDSNFLMAICEADGTYGLAALEVSTGEFLATTLDGADANEALQAELTRLRPAECLIASSQQVLTETLHLNCTLCEPQAFELEAAQQHLEQQFGSDTAWQDGHTPLALRAAGAILQYVQAMHKTALQHLTYLRPYRLSQYMVLDAVTRRNLELVRTMRHGERHGSLLNALDETMTSMGKRLLQRWIEQPLLQCEAIEARLEAVEELVSNAACRAQLRQILRRMYDAERLVGRIACGTANARALAGLRQTLAALPTVRDLLTDCHAPRLQTLLADCSGESDIVTLLEQSIVDEPPITIRDGGLIRTGYDAALDDLIRKTDRDKQWVARLQARERQRTGIKSLKVGFNQVFGYYIEVSKANIHLVPADYQRKQTLTNGERYITDKLKERETAILSASEQRVELEYTLFVDIREHLAREAALLQRIASALAQLDTLAALAEVAVLYNYVKPEVGEGAAIHIRQGRHPVVERMVDGFVPNDLALDHEHQRLTILTGPNMAGKSTYLRQLAHIVLLAQMGSFVPAEQAHIGLVDRIFTRVGAVDDIAAGRSTFLVEMSETAHILHHATPQSLLILDEIGKGTSTFEGLSIAWAVALYIVRRLGTRGLFATHYHELTALETLYPGIGNFHMAIRETDDGIIFLRQMVPGGASKSYGLHVARLAGLPTEVLDESARVLSYLEQQGTQPAAGPPPMNGVHGATSEPIKPAPTGLTEQLLSLDLCQVTPLQALTLLHQLQQQVREWTGPGGSAR
ncbi:DNA mismatch repair protein MutS [Candidatus Entotheonella palauensis]|uniref:DNA mismatch repair protein MutS n=1 Tax=Candidatus Entotheonella palauensis TaxID=93172 RepID=UPI0021195FAE|nr:DNA mismatch repair protein MutS [Candidatus Entotheonella palauensis]